MSATEEAVRLGTVDPARDTLAALAHHSPTSKDARPVNQIR
jgi:hypothetical protein